MVGVRDLPLWVSGSLSVCLTPYTHTRRRDGFYYNFTSITHGLWRLLMGRLLSLIDGVFTILLSRFSGGRQIHLSLSPGLEVVRLYGVTFSSQSALSGP